MPPDTLRTALATLHLSERGLAAITGWSPGAVRNWVQGRAAVPPPVAAWLARRLEQWQADPPPQRAA